MKAKEDEDERVTQTVGTIFVLMKSRSHEKLSSPHPDSTLRLAGRGMQREIFE